MARKPADDTPQTADTKAGTRLANARQDRLKAALKANMARRKAQARAKAQVGSGDAGHETPDNEK